MEINPNGKIPRPVYPENISETGKPKDKTFRAVLGQLIDNPSEVDAEDKRTPAMSKVTEVELNPFLSEKRMAIIKGAERLLDTLDNYQQKLADPEVTLKDIFSFIDEMKEENKNMVSVFNSLPDGDKLKEILNQVLITSSIEIIKFNRGDYVRQ